MSNRIDVYIPQNEALAVSAVGMEVELEGCLCPFLEPLELVRAEYPEFSWAKLRYNPAGWDAPDKSGPPAEELEALLGMGKRICLRRVVKGAAEPVVRAVSIFTGHIEAIDTRIDGAGEQVEVIARDASAALGRITVYGQRVGVGEANTFLAGLETVFNEAAKGNAADTPAVHNGRSYTVFSAQGAEGGLWTAALVLAYLLNEYCPPGLLRIPPLAQLAALTQGQVPRDLDVTGLNLIEALERCCRQVGLRFRFTACDLPAGVAQVIVFYRPATGGPVELGRQADGERLDTTATTIATLRSRRSFWPVTHRYIGQGDFKIYEATFSLIKAWDPAQQDTDYAKFSPLTNQNFHEVRNVYRKWCLNEAGDYSDSPYDQGPAFDFEEVFEADSFVRRCRRFRPTLSRDETGSSLGYFLEVSYNNGAHWWQYLYAFDILLDECGVWLSSDQLDLDTWFAVLKGVLKFRITASVVADQRLTCVAADGPVDSTAEVLDRLAILPRQFKYRKVSKKSIFAAGTWPHLAEPDEADDSVALRDYVRRLAESDSAVIETIETSTLLLCLSYEPGRPVSAGPDGRDILGCRADSRSVWWIDRVRMDFVNQCTQLKILRRRT
jgi:hypothetical protein